MQLLPPVDLSKWKITQDFGVCIPSTCGWYKNILGINGHNGLDIGCPKGTPIVASHDGFIKRQISSDGNYIIWNENKNLYLKTMNCHLSEYKKNTGEFVKKGEIIGLSGGKVGDIGSGNLTTGAHLHFGVYQIDKDGRLLNPNNGYNGAVDPLPFIVQKLNNFDLIKTPFENKVYEIRNGYKWWIFDEETYKKLLGKNVALADLKVVDFPTFNYYPYGGIVGKP